MNSNNLPQRIFKRHEISIADYLMGFQQALKNEFLESLQMFNKDCTTNAKNFITLGLPPTDMLEPTLNYLIQHTNSTPNMEMWKVKDLKYTNELIGKYFI